MSDLCVICDKAIDWDVDDDPGAWRLGCNAWPVTDGQCCETCNKCMVIPARLIEMRDGSDWAHVGIRDGRGTLGIAVRNQPGYYTQALTFGAGVHDKADSLNAGRGMTDEEAYELIVSSMKAQN